MEATYCGKSCETCPEKQNTACPGCKGEQGMSSECPVARCCRSSRRESCQSCPAAGRCGALADADKMARQRASRRERQEAAASSARPLAKWFWILFGSILAQLLCDGIGFLIGSGSWLIMLLWSVIQLPVALVCQIIFLVICWKLGAWDHRYRTAVFCCLAAMAAYFICKYIGTYSLPGILLLLFVAAAGIYGQYHVLSAHGSVSGMVDTALPHKWQMLWKLTLVGLGLAGLQAVASLLLPSVRYYLSQVSTILEYVVAILNLVYLCQTALAFRRCWKS